VQCIIDLRLFITYTRCAAPDTKYRIVGISSRRHSNLKMKVSLFCYIQLVGNSKILLLGKLNYCLTKSNYLIWLRKKK